ncbi:plasmid mobilization protein, partial [Clostridium perfringens]|uniref:plasmid mobilization protein n=2 Tax=Clostridium perfringens TaxID=1502 RepID=UPI0039E9DA86
LVFEYPKGHIKYDRKTSFTILLGLGQSPPRPHPTKIKDFLGVKRMIENRKREKQIKFYVNEKEYEQIKKKVEKSKLKQQEYLIKSALNKKIIVVDGLKEILLELSREGNNLNQIAKKINEGEQKDIKEMKNKLNNLWDLIEKILKESNK